MKNIRTRLFTISSLVSPNYIIKGFPIMKTPFVKRTRNMIPLITALITVLMSTILVACYRNANASPNNNYIYLNDIEYCGSTVNNFSSMPNDTIILILDVDVCSSTDDLAALQLFYYYVRHGQCEPGGIIVDRMDSLPHSASRFAATVDVWNKFFNQQIPIGVERNGVPYHKVNRFIKYDSILRLRDSKGDPLFKGALDSNELCGLPDGWKLYRDLLTFAPNHSIKIVVTGFLSSIAQLLESEGGVELVRRKVNCVYIMGTALGTNKKKLGYNMDKDIASAKTFFRLWPKDVDCVFSPGNVGELIYLDSAAIVSYINDSVTQGKHPMKSAYQCRPNDSLQFMWDVLPTINAVEGDGLFCMSPRGTIKLDSVVNDGKTKYYCVFNPDIDGNYRYQMPPDDNIVNEWREAVIRRIKSSLYVQNDITN